MSEQVAEKTLNIKDLQSGESGRVIGFEPMDLAYRRQLLAMGLTRGVEFLVQRRAPLGDPIEIRVRGFALSLRQDEVSALIIERVL